MPVVPPYHINKDFEKAKYKENASKKRKKLYEISKEKWLAFAGEKGRKTDEKTKITIDDFLNKLSLSSGAKAGKAQPSDLSLILTKAVELGLVKFDSNEMHQFLKTNGLSVDCSGYVSQGFNYLEDGNKNKDKNDVFDVVNTGSGTLKGGQADFDIKTLSELMSGDTMHLNGHIRIIHEVVTDGDITYLRVSESTATHDTSTKNGILMRWWKFDGNKQSYSWQNPSGGHPDKDEKKGGWISKKETLTFGRLKVADTKDKARDLPAKPVDSTTNKMKNDTVSPHRHTVPATIARIGTPSHG